MRIACLHVPQFALQHATRLDPALRGAPVAVVGASEGARDRGPAARVLGVPIVHACSRAAWALGVRVGMTATSARALSPQLEIVTVEAMAERETVRAIADALRGITGTVDAGGRVGAGGAHLAMYAEVPAKTRGHAFGERVLEVLDALGLTARIGIADDRFTAWVAAAHAGADHHDESAAVEGRSTPAPCVVPRGGSAAFLAPRPLSLLAIPPEVQHMLEALGVTTLGQFAALPAPSVARPLEADYQALARGESGTLLRPYVPETAIREELVVRAGNVLDSARGVSAPAAIAMIARRIALRLAGRGRLAAQLEVRAGERELPLDLDRPTAEPEELARALAPAIAEANAEAWRLCVVVAGEAVTAADAPAADARMAHEAATRAAEPSTIDPMTLVLSSPGSLFALATPDLRAERRDAHRRTRRGKQRRVRPTPAAQSRLFDRGS